MKDPDASIFPNMRFRDRDPPTSILNMSNLSSRDCPDKSFKPIFARIVVYKILRDRQVQILKASIPYDFNFTSNELMHVSVLIVSKM